MNRSARTALLLFATLLAAACGARTSPKSQVVPPSEFLKLTPSDEIYELSSARLQIRRLAPQAVRLLAPHWSRVRESERKTLQVTLVGTLAEERLAPFLRMRLKEAVDANPALAAQAIEWLKSPLGYEVKFAEATAWTALKVPDAAFYASVNEVRDNQLPEVRMKRILQLSEAIGALQGTLDVTKAVGTVVARLVNVARPDAKPVPVEALEVAVERERHKPEVGTAYAPVVAAALLLRFQNLDLDELDRYIDFAISPAGHWYHQTMISALIAAVDSASADVEGVFAANARNEEVQKASAGFDLDSLLVSLPSGREVRLLAMAQAGPKTQPSIVLRYETSLPLENSAAVKGEAQEVWDKVRDQIESEGARAAVLQATGSVDGWVFPFASSRKFAWKREEGGQWIAAKAEGSPALGGLQREMLWSVPP